MKKTYFSIITLLLTGLFFKDESCKKINPVMSANTGFMDGPYVLYKDGKAYVRYVLDDAGLKSVKTDTIDLASVAGKEIVVGTDEQGKTFTVKLKAEIKTPSSVYPGAGKQMIISDIEGNFRFFKKLLVANGVIDSNYNWTFGDGHLVLTGDYMDRGSQVTECLWLIYSLEDKAAAAGGQVHFILGNHEIMNMSGDLRYLHPKYKEAALLLNEKFENLIGGNSEIGRWLRSKNIMEKVGDILFTHAGISPQINRMDLTLERLNELTRPWYPDSSFKYNDPRLDTIFSDFGPFWYRGYYKAPSPTVSRTIDSSLNKFAAKYVATGHTVVKDTISMWYDGKLFNTDVHHASGRSEGLLLEDNKFYRVTTLGEKFLIKE